MECKKIRFASEDRILEHIRMWKKTAKREVTTGHYFCEKCNTWHLTRKVSETEKDLRMRIDSLQKQLAAATKADRHSKEVAADIRVADMLTTIDGLNKQLRKMKETNKRLLEQLLKLSSPQNP